MCGPPYVVRRRRSPESLWQRMKVELNGGGEERVLALSGHADFIGSARRSIPRGHRALYAPLASAYGWDCARACASVGAFPACVQNSGQTAELASLLAGPPRLLGLDDSGKRSWAGWQWLMRVSLEANVDVPLCGGCASCPRPSSLVGPQFCVCRRCTTAVGIGGCTHTTLPARPQPTSSTHGKGDCGSTRRASRKTRPRFRSCCCPSSWRAAPDVARPPRHTFVERLWCLKEIHHADALLLARGL